MSETNTSESNNDPATGKTSACCHVPFEDRAGVGPVCPACNGGGMAVDPLPRTEAEEIDDLLRAAGTDTHVREMIVAMAADGQVKAARAVASIALGEPIENAASALVEILPREALLAVSAFGRAADARLAQAKKPARRRKKAAEN